MAQTIIEDESSRGEAVKLTLSPEPRPIFFRNQIAPATFALKSSESQPILGKNTTQLKLLKESRQVNHLNYEEKDESNNNKPLFCAKRRMNNFVDSSDVRARFHKTTTTNSVIEEAYQEKSCSGGQVKPSFNYSSDRSADETTSFDLQIKAESTSIAKTDVYLDLVRAQNVRSKTKDAHLYTSSDGEDLDVRDRLD